MQLFLKVILNWVSISQSGNGTLNKFQWKGFHINSLYLSLCFHLTYIFVGVVAVAAVVTIASVEGILLSSSGLEA